MRCIPTVVLTLFMLATVSAAEQNIPYNPFLKNVKEIKARIGGRALTHDELQILVNVDSTWRRAYTIYRRDRDYSEQKNKAIEKLYYKIYRKTFRQQAILMAEYHVAMQERKRFLIKHSARDDIEKNLKNSKKMLDEVIQRSYEAKASAYQAAGIPANMARVMVRRKELVGAFEYQRLTKLLTPSFKEKREWYQTHLSDYQAENSYILRRIRVRMPLKAGEPVPDADACARACGEIRSRIQAEGNTLSPEAITRLLNDEAIAKLTDAVEMERREGGRFWAGSFGLDLQSLPPAYRAPVEKLKTPGACSDFFQAEGYWVLLVLERFIPAGPLPLSDTRVDAKIQAMLTKAKRKKIRPQWLLSTIGHITVTRPGKEGGGKTTTMADIVRSHFSELKGNTEG